MARNVEVKVRLSDLIDVRVRIAALGARYSVTEEQVDRYFELDSGRRVKLRSIAGAAAQLIHYDRPETSGMRVSTYEITAVRDDDAGVCLVPKGEPLVVVRKQREVHLLDNVRVHLDRVDGLGSFLELEAVVDAQHDESRCRAQVERITRALWLRDADFIRASYADLLLSHAR
jgi:predicted adenylyl cyclase CyaB